MASNPAEVQRKYVRSTNMTYQEFSRWAESRCSRMASLDRRPINRNLRLLKKLSEGKEFTRSDVAAANKTIGFIARMRRVKRGKPVCGDLSKRDIALLNWAYDPRKRL